MKKIIILIILTWCFYTGLQAQDKPKSVDMTISYQICADRVNYGVLISPSGEVDVFSGWDNKYTDWAVRDRKGKWTVKNVDSALNIIYKTSITYSISASLSDDLILKQQDADNKEFLTPKKLK